MIARENQVDADEDSGQTMVEPDGGIENANFACLLCGHILICKQADSSVHMVSSPNLPFYRLVFIFYVFLLFNRQCVSVCQYGVISTASGALVVGGVRDIYTSSSSTIRR